MSISIDKVRTSIFVVALGFAVLFGQANPAWSGPGWLSKFLGEAGTSGKPAGLASGRAALPLKTATLQLGRLRPEPGRLLVAAIVSAEGHWTFVDKAGQRFTAASRDELHRVIQAFRPDVGASAGGAEPEGLDIVVADAVLFHFRDAFKDLPDSARVMLATSGGSYRVRGAFRNPAARLAIDVRPNVQLQLTTPVALTEALWQLGRPLRDVGVRVLALDVRGPAKLPSRARIDSRTKSLVSDRIDPIKLARAMSVLRGQTAVISARIEDDLLAYRVASGGEGHIALKDVVGAAEQVDANLIFLNAQAPRQPGDRNWLWQTVTIDGLDRALASATMGEFLGALAGDGGVVVAVGSLGEHRTALIGRRVAGTFVIPGADRFGGIFAEVISEVAGTVVTNGIRMDLVSSERRKELDARLLPGIPSDVQFFYIGAFVLGLLGGSVAWGWWSHIWPAERAGEYVDRAGYTSARGVRLVLFVLVFVPIAGPFAFGWQAVTVVFLWLMVPFRWMRRAGGKTSEAG